MKKTYIILSCLFLMLSCDQEIIDLQEPEVEVEDCEGGSPGSLDFSNFISIGNSLTSGYQAGALFTEGQENSLPNILAKQFACVGGPETFNQPDVNSVNGFNLTASDPENDIILGRYILFDDGSGPRPTPAGAPGVPAPYNTADLISPYTGDEDALNNFGVPGAKLVEAAGAPNYGTLNPYYGRFASNPTSKTMLEDAVEELPTFFMMWLGNQDVLAYALSGGTGAEDGVDKNDMTPEATFSALYPNALNAFLAVPGSKGVVANIPDVKQLPYFNTVPYNAIPLDANTATVVNGAYAGYNQVLEALKGAPFNYPAEEVNARKISFQAGQNSFVIIDESVEDYTDEFDFLENVDAITPEERAALEPYVQVRQTTSNDLVLFTAATVLGTLAIPGNPLSVRGVAVPIEDQYVLTEDEITIIQDRTEAFNSIISNAVDGAGDRVALVDVYTAFKSFETYPMQIVDGVVIADEFAPPFSLFSEDGVHPNSRGYAYLAKLFIASINAKFGATIPTVNIAKYSTTRIPVTP